MERQACPRLRRTESSEIHPRFAWPHGNCCLHPRSSFCYHYCPHSSSSGAVRCAVASYFPLHGCERAWRVPDTPRDTLQQWIGALGLLGQEAEEPARALHNQGSASLPKHYSDHEHSITGLLCIRFCSVSCSRFVFPASGKASSTTARMSTKIYVGNLSWNATAEDLKAAFGQYGEVEDSFIPLDRDSGR